jgi:hypothetical protein
MHAAGITCSQLLGDLIASLEPAAEPDAVRLLAAEGTATTIDLVRGRHLCLFG